MKEELCAELLKELEAEKDAEIAKENEEMFPSYCKENLEDIVNIDKKFTAVIKNKGKMTKKQIEELKMMKTETEKAMALLTKINEKLDKYM